MEELDELIAEEERQEKKEEEKRQEQKGNFHTPPPFPPLDPVYLEELLARRPRTAYNGNKLTEEEVADINILAQSGRNPRLIAMILGLAIKPVRAHIDPKYLPPSKAKSKKQIRKLCEDENDNLPCLPEPDRR